MDTDREMVKKEEKRRKRATMIRSYDLIVIEFSEIIAIKCVQNLIGFHIRVKKKNKGKR